MAKIVWVGGPTSLAEALTADGHEVAVARSPADALARARTDAIDVVVCGDNDTSDELRALRPDVELIRVVDASVPERQGTVRVGHPADLPSLRAAVRVAIELRALRASAEGGRRDTPALTWGAESMRPVVEALGRLAPTDATVLLHGELGSGRTTAARVLHAWSPRADAPFRVVQCAGRPVADVARDLFGDARHRGHIELAAAGTLFLAQATEVAPELQVVLVRMLHEGGFTRPGAGWNVDCTARLVLGTRYDPAELVQSGRLREDLALRASVFQVRIPPLRERAADVVPLARVLLAGIAARLGRPGLTLDGPAEGALRARTWPGNVVELANALERAALLAPGPEIGVAWVTLPAGRDALPSPRNLEQVEREAVANALAHVNGNRRKAADILGIGERTLYDKLRRYGLS